MSNVTKRIHDLTHRRLRLWACPWYLWTPDMEVRINFLTRLLEEAWHERRKEVAQGDSPK